MNKHIQIILGAMLFKDSPWSSEPRQQSGKQRYTWRKSFETWLSTDVGISCIRTNMKRCTPPSLIAEQCCTWRIMSYCHLQHGYDFWTMLSHSCEYWKDALTKTDCGTILFWSSKAHFIAWIWVIKWTSLMMPLHFFSLSDLTSWEEFMRKTIEHTTMSFSLQAMRCMSGRLDDFHEDWW